MEPTSNSSFLGSSYAQKPKEKNDLPSLLSTKSPKKLLIEEEDEFETNSLFPSIVSKNSVLEENSNDSSSNDIQLILKHSTAYFNDNHETGSIGQSNQKKKRKETKNSTKSLSSNVVEPPPDYMHSIHQNLLLTGGIELISKEAKKKQSKTMKKQTKKKLENDIISTLQEEPKKETEVSSIPLQSKPFSSSISSLQHYFIESKTPSNSSPRDSSEKDQSNSSLQRNTIQIVKDPPKRTKKRKGESTGSSSSIPLSVYLLCPEATT